MYGFEVGDRVRVVTENGNLRDESVHFFDIGTTGYVTEKLGEGFVVAAAGITQFVLPGDIEAE